ncbi:endo-1,4-beta-xylanase [Robertkochia solimangrovi]|uniref:endo-1,4-beta-xylanase n=1 Tax=Robertkochia solimangrovi TaxID=2213046 RepID=UPI00117F9E01|nr:endo-1,4-beta-xylanase [Robertkochia solimangrovi]TRZ42497.1 hypothetical protein DMZ48_13420 [Robertkochia solimangrovi]
MKQITALLIYILLISCSSGDDGSDGKKIGGPVDSIGEDDDGNDNGGDSGDPLTYDATQNLKEVAGFHFGNVISAAKIASSSTDNSTMKSIFQSEFNSITAENDMKMRNMFTGADTYDFSDGDAIVAWAKENDMRVHGHTLVWHSSIPDWLANFSGTDEEFSTQVENYIKATVSHFATEKMTVDGTEVSVVASWDVVNEAFTSEGTSSIFRTRLGADYVAKCFQWAREADPDVALFYNDYNIAGEPSKRSQIINMANDFIENEIPIDGIGMQMHLNHDWPTSDLETAIQEVANTGLLVHISELDVKVNYSEDISELNEARAMEQETQYQRVAYYYSNSVPQAQQWGITVWGFRDKDSWLYKNNSDWPLLYNHDFETKLAHRGLINGLSGIEP